MGNVQADLGICPQAETNGYWGGNSPANLDSTASAKNGMTLKDHDTSLAILPVFDIA